MTRIVYADPDISPDVWTPPRGVVVLPISEHPAIVADGRVEKLPPGEPRPRKIEAALLTYLRNHPPTDALVIADNLNLNWRSVKSALEANPGLFRRMGKVPGKYAPKTVWALVET